LQAETERSTYRLGGRETEREAERQSDSEGERDTSKRERESGTHTHTYAHTRTHSHLADDVGTNPSTLHLELACRNPKP
jgi:hypothetical protein